MCTVNKETNDLLIFTADVCLVRAGTAQVSLITLTDCRALVNEISLT